MQSGERTRALARVILEDPALTAQVLKVANSTFYNLGGRRITTVSRAFVILGFDNIRRLVLGLRLSGLLALLPEHHIYRRLWRHSLATAFFSRDLACLAGGAEGEAVFIAGLLHDIGKFILGHLHGEEYVALLECHACELDFDFCRAEREAFACNPQEVGALLAHSWGLPRELIQVVSRHRPGSDWREFYDALPELRAFVVLANRMARVMELRELISRDEFQCHVRQLAVRAQTGWGIEPEKFAVLFDEINEKLLVAAAYFGIRLDDFYAPVAADGPPVVAREINGAGLLEASIKISEAAARQPGGEER